MSVRYFTTLAFFTSFAPLFAQAPPMPLPPTVLAQREAEVRLPFPEKLIPFDAKTLSVKRLNGSWQIWVNNELFRSFGENRDDANDVTRTLQELYPQRWGRIGTDRTVVEYGLTLNNEQKLSAPQVAGFARLLIAMDLKTLKVERVRGMWCLRDEGNLLLNFGQHRGDAEQALAVVQKYGFNRIGTVGRKEAVMTYFTSNPDGLAQASATLPPAVSFQMQANAMTRTGIPLPQFGLLGQQKRVDPSKLEYIGEMIAIDPRTIELRNEGQTIQLVHGRQVLATFAANDAFAAREAVRAIQESRLTEYCQFGTAGVSFFLSNGQAPRKMPFHTLGHRFDPNGTRTMQIRGTWHVTDGSGRPLAPAGSREEAEQLKELLRAFGFDQLSTFTSAGKTAMTVFIKAR